MIIEAGKTYLTREGIPVKVESTAAWQVGKMPFTGYRQDQAGEEHEVFEYYYANGNVRMSAVDDDDLVTELKEVDLAVPEEVVERELDHEDRLAVWAAFVADKATGFGIDFWINARKQLNKA